MKAKKLNGGKWITPERRLGVHIRDGFQCAYCGKDLRNAAPKDATLDHLNPRSQAEGKPDHSSANLVTACRSCNSARGDRPWRAYATGGAIERILVLTTLPVNLALAKALIAGTAGDDELEALHA